MKSMIRLVLFCGILAAVFPAISSVPLRWTVETSRLQPVVFDALHGETLELEASFNSYGKPLEIKGEAALFYQTNGMGSAWWQIPATVTSNRIEAVFPPSADPGAARLSCFLGGPASTYRAAFSLRFANSPGATPNALPLPSMSYEAAALVSNIVDRSYVEGLGVSGGAVSSVNGHTGAVMLAAADVGALPNTGGTLAVEQVDKGSRIIIKGAEGNWEDYIPEGGWVKIAGGDSDEGGSIEIGGAYGTGGSLKILPPSANGLEAIYGLEILPYEDGTGGGFIKVNGTDVMEAIGSKADASTVNALSNTVTQWTTYWDGDDVRVTITNYYGSMALPSMYLEQRMPADDTHDGVWFKTVWNEMTRWNDFLGGYSSVTNELEQKADRAWGFYDSATGEFSPDGYLQISTPHVILANGMAYQKTVTTGGCSMWVLTATQPTTLTGETEQGFFRIQDGDGNALFEIVKGDKRIAGATATALTMDSGSMVITYPVSGDHPTLSVCTDLKAADWQTGEDITVATVAWSGGSGNWVATVTPVGPRPSLFCKASYEVGGNTYIKNNVATSIDKVVVGGHEYNVTVETINGKKLLVLQ